MFDCCSGIPVWAKEAGCCLVCQPQFPKAVGGRGCFCRAAAHITISHILLLARSFQQDVLGTDDDGAQAAEGRQAHPQRDLRVCNVTLGWDETKQAHVTQKVLKKAGTEAVEKLACHCLVGMGGYA